MNAPRKKDIQALDKQVKAIIRAFDMEVSDFELESMKKSILLSILTEDLALEYDVLINPEHYAEEDEEEEDEECSSSGTDAQ